MPNPFLDVVSRKREGIMASHVLNSFTDSHEWTFRHQTAAVKPVRRNHHNVIHNRDFMMKACLLLVVLLATDASAVTAAIETRDTMWSDLAAASFGGTMGVLVGISQYRGSWRPQDLPGLGQELMGNFCLAIVGGIWLARLLAPWFLQKADVYWIWATSAAMCIGGMIVVKTVIQYLPEWVLGAMNINRKPAVPVVPEMPKSDV